ncbi:ATP-binding protein [Streptomyces milbemycinicus]|uniref:ATP-binding protein n=1 Tax=Streptomyces milbemycinicus TaxID=476552 RepID=A0ABW8LJ62_9ACTN
MPPGRLQPYRPKPRFRRQDGGSILTTHVDDRPVLPAPDVFHVKGGEDAVGDVRDRIATVTTAWGVPLSPGALGDVKLCASEIITNALTHAGGRCWVTTERTGRHLCVAVADRSLRLPVVAAPGLDRESGRGLAIVEALACSWGWEPNDLGKRKFTDVGRPKSRPSASPSGQE